MATYVVLANFTDKGVHDAKDTLTRMEKFKAMAVKAGVKVSSSYWTIGSIDIVTICEAPDDETMTALSLSVGSRGYVRTQTLRAFDPTEMAKVLGKLA